MTLKQKIAVIGVGNKLMGDDGFGIHAIEYLRSQNLPARFELIDGGTGGIALLHIFEKYERAVIIDAADFGGKPGETRKFSLNEVNLANDSNQISLHGVSLAGILKLAETLGKKMPEIKIIAVQPKEIAPSTELSEQCAAALPNCLRLVVTL